MAALMSVARDIVGIVCLPRTGVIIIGDTFYGDLDQVMTTAKQLRAVGRGCFNQREAEKLFREALHAIRRNKS